MNIHVPTVTRRRFLQGLTGGALLAASPHALWADNESTVTISILHTTDLHGHILPTVDYQGNPNVGGLARCATQIRQWQREAPNSILLDIGDVYQGTEVSLRAGGANMIRCLNALRYDAWVVGNHEFDWGMGPFTESVQHSDMPVLSGNSFIEGQPVGTLTDASHPLSRIKPYLIKEVAGIRLAIVAITTPALTTWEPPEHLRGFEALDPIDTLRVLLPEVRAQKPDAIVLTGHMGLIRIDDNANRVGAITRTFPEIAVFLGGHTHQNHSSDIINRVLYTQADHFGLYAGKVDLTFDRASRRLLQSHAITVPMDAKVALDPVVLSLTQADLDAAALTMAQPVGELTEPLSVTTTFNEPGDIVRLIGSAIRFSLRQKGVEVDAIVHGLFDNKRSLAPGPKTVADIWEVLPYENDIVTFDVNRSDFLALARDLANARNFSSGRDERNLMGVRIRGTWNGTIFTVSDLVGLSGPLPDKPTYRIALNSYDSQSGGGRFPVVAKLVAQPGSNRVLQSLDTRGALIDFFVAQKKVSKASLLI